MPKTTTSIYVNEIGQCQTTIPKALAEAMGLEKGDKVRWSVKSGSKLEMEVVDDD